MPDASYSPMHPSAPTTQCDPDACVRMCNPGATLVLLVVKQSSADFGSLSRRDGAFALASAVAIQRTSRPGRAESGAAKAPHWLVKLVFDVPNGEGIRAHAVESGCSRHSLPFTPPSPSLSHPIYQSIITFTCVAQYQWRHRRHTVDYSR